MRRAGQASETAAWLPPCPSLHAGAILAPAHVRAHEAALPPPWLRRVPLWRGDAKTAEGDQTFEPLYVGGYTEGEWEYIHNNDVSGFADSKEHTHLHTDTYMGQRTSHVFARHVGVALRAPAWRPDGAAVRALGSLYIAGAFAC